MSMTENRYTKIIERVFLTKYQSGSKEVVFKREDIEKVAKQLKIKLPKNIGDIIYSFRYRANLPLSIAKKAPKGLQWIIRPRGKSLYAFVATSVIGVTPNRVMAEIKIPDSTPGVIAKYALTDEQALLAKLRYNRLIDIFTGVTCYSLQSHLRSSVKEMGQVETDEIYVGLDKNGVHYVFPVQAKGSKDKLGIVQIEQDLALCMEKFPALVCRAMAAQFMEENLIALFEFEETDKGVSLTTEKHYRLVPQELMTEKDLEEYRKKMN